MPLTVLFMLTFRNSELFIQRLDVCVLNIRTFPKFSSDEGGVLEYDSDDTSSSSPSRAEAGLMTILNSGKRHVITKQVCRALRGNVAGSAQFFNNWDRVEGISPDKLV
ncbi:hypothetical protein SNK03_000527 [Fusarium graminearum]|uniref:Chromosome 1, complete genome n=1 Tax=Gibberella zeae (strain ATCC MYA-4620 / CBS 123657 / FGSC 9075 / NRRL 31084 / PH-1) TaxID=229533 RepID=I1RAA5_GIBZE|nr:hypothetical protein FGSG_00432 [Fusarium graminearum PH-1]ESU05614.1 hypothetical protein FGSG_00432 [Fusarium graminearum PH-1]EYB30736.1 hypothetical protein FG05_00432 [Fusarium graminearum]CEF72363.1 unnamed protein product [Fusarium graminearum]CZS75626.1 unnamed protein product [Fusarium graminearum]|eukprot:XP_011316099.1 hypothetical protein FGSG_00432 [Fusarium graminearum PH-1]